MLTGVGQEVARRAIFDHERVQGLRVCCGALPRDRLDERAIGREEVQPSEGRGWL